MSEAVGRHAVALASVHELAVRSGAQRVVLLVDEGEDSDATMIEYAGNELELTEAGITEPVAPGDIGQVAPAVLPDLQPVPARIYAEALTAKQRRRQQPVVSVTETMPIGLELAEDVDL